MQDRGILRPRITITEIAYGQRVFGEVNSLGYFLIFLQRNSCIILDFCTQNLSVGVIPIFQNNIRKTKSLLSKGFVHKIKGKVSVFICKAKGRGRGTCFVARKLQSL